MGEMADYYVDKAMWQQAEFEMEIENLYISYKIKELYWETKNGESILIQNMEDSHIENCIKYLEKNNTGEAWIKIFNLELEKRKTIKTNNMIQVKDEFQEVQTQEVVPQNPTQAITKFDGFQNVEEMIQYAEILIKGKLIPAHFRTPESVVSAIQMGRELKLGAMVSLNGIIPINGLPTLKANLQSALVRNSGVAFKTIKDFVPIYSNGTNLPSPPRTNDNGETVKDKPVDYETTIRFYVKWNNTVIEDDVTFKWSMAVAASWASKDNWKKMPTQMMWSRCFTTGARRNASDALNGMYETSEMIDSVPNSDFIYEVDQEGNMKVKPK